MVNRKVSGKKKKNQSVVKKAKCWVLRKGKNSTSETPKYTQYKFYFKKLTNLLPAMLYYPGWYGRRLRGETTIQNDIYE